MDLFKAYLRVIIFPGLLWLPAGQNGPMPGKNQQVARVELRRPGVEDGSVRVNISACGILYMGKQLE